MKKTILTFLTFISIFALTVNIFAADGDITQAEVRPDVVKWSLKEARFLPQTKICEIMYIKKDSGDNVIQGTREKILFMDRVDNPETPEDETLTEFTDLITAINNGSNIKTTIKNAVKLKLGIQ